MVGTSDACCACMNASWMGDSSTFEDGVGGTGDVIFFRCAVPDQLSVEESRFAGMTSGVSALRDSSEPLEALRELFELLDPC